MADNNTSSPQALTVPAVQLSLEIKQAINKLLLKYPKDKRLAASIGSLLLVQEDNGGYLTTELMDAVAEHLQVPNVAIYEVATFYSMYELKPVGRHKICLCTNVSCKLRGSNNIAEYLKKKLNINFNETTKDGRFTLKSVECLAACGGAPAMQIGDHYYENLDNERIDEILANLK